MTGVLQEQNVVILRGSSGIAVTTLALKRGAVVFALSHSGKAPGSAEGIKVEVSERDAVSVASGTIVGIDHLRGRPSSECSSRTLPRQSSIASTWPCATFVGLARAFLSWQRQVRSRRDLARLDDRALRDLGLERWAVEAEATMSYWRFR